MQGSKKVLRGCSGGADSCRAAEKLKAQGYEVTALTLLTHGDGSMVDGARAKAVQLGVDFRVEDVRERF